MLSFIPHYYKLRSANVNIISTSVTLKLFQCYKMRGNLNFNFYFKDFTSNNNLLVSHTCIVSLLLTNTIGNVTAQRISEFLLSTITSTSSVPLKIPPGLSSLQEELSSLAAKYHRLVSYNRDVFGEFYTDILESARLKQQ